MCDTCGVTEGQYNDARLVAHKSCMVTLLEENNVDPVSYGYQHPSAEAIRVANDRIQRYHAGHPGRGLTRDELVAEFAKRGVQL